MNKKIKYLMSTGILLGGIVGAPIAHADTVNLNSEATINLEDVPVIEDFNASEFKDELLYSDKYETTTSTEVKELEDGTTLEIEKIAYKEVATRVSVGTNFGTYETIKFRDPLNYYKGTVNVDVQGKKTGSNTAKINYIRYKNSDFKNGSSGAYGPSKIVSTGNPARGFINVHYAWSDWDASPQNTYTVINVRVYPNTNIIVG